MRSRAGLVALGALLLVGCAVEVKNSDNAAGSAGVAGSAGSGVAGAGASAGTAGTAGAGGAAAGSSGAGQAGSGQAGAGGEGCAGDPCGEVSELGACAGNVLQHCVSPPLNSACGPVLHRVDCGAGATCVADGAGARCQSKTSCQVGDTYCDGNTLMTCQPDGSGFEPTLCPATSVCKTAPKAQARCEAASGEVGEANSLKGCVKFERRGMDKTGPTDITIDDAWYQFVAIYNGSNYIDSALTGPDGCFDTQLTEAATADTKVYVYTIDFDEQNQPLIGLVRNNDPSISSHSSDAYWFWGNDGDASCGLQPAKVTPSADGKHSMATLTIPEACGSGAIRIFQWVRFAMLRLGPGSSVASTNTRKQDSLAIFWSPGVKSDCGACFLGKNTGSATVTPADGATDYYSTLMQISGTPEFPGHWSYSAQSQLAGLWALSTYGRMPGEGGQHFMTKPSKPGIAFSFGWATAFAQRNVSVTADDNAGTTEYDSMYIDTQSGTTFWIDLNKLDTSTGAIEMPSATQGIDQPINEFAVAAALWRLWQPPAAGEGAFRGLGDSKMFQALGSDRILNGTNRGYVFLDMLDYLDATRCSSAATAEDVDAVAKQITFPWDATPSCN